MEQPSGDPLNPAPASPAPAVEAADSLETLITALQADRLWLLRQIDSGRWSNWRLDLAALERELGQLLDQVEQRKPAS